MSEEPPFTYCGIGLFGPFVVKDGRKEVKSYGALYTCLSSRSIHIEVVHSMSTHCFIMSLRRFIGRKGNVRMIRFNNGSNLVGASAELIRAFQEMDHIKFTNFLEENGGEWIHWKRNPPLSSNMGGVWEPQIRSARAVLNSLLKMYGTSLSDESLHTLLVEVEAVVNSRPLTTDVMNDVTSLAALSPINLLTLKSKVVMPPPGNFVSPDQYSRKHWRRVQHISNEFWNRCRKEVLMSLQTRTKWHKQQRNCKVEDVALLKEDSKRNRWPMAKIVSVNSDVTGDVRSVRLLVGTSAKSDNSIRYLKRPVKTLVSLVENEDYTEY